eukprot:3726315-Pyramimonas_sp.AAC.1
MTNNPTPAVVNVCSLQRCRFVTGSATASLRLPLSPSPPNTKLPGERAQAARVGGQRAGSGLRGDCASTRDLAREAGQAPLPFRLLARPLVRGDTPVHILLKMRADGGSGWLGW